MAKESNKETKPVIKINNPTLGTVNKRDLSQFEKKNINKRDKESKK